MSLSLSIDSVGFKEAELALMGVKDGFPKAATNAINRGLGTGKKVAAQLIGANYNLKAAVVKDSIEVKNANWSGLVGWLEAKGPMLPIRAFEPTVKLKQIRRRGPKAQFVSAKIKRGGRGKLIKGAFKAKGRIWERREPGRDAPLGIVSTIGIPYMVRKLAISKKIQEAIAETTQKRLDHEVSRLLTPKRVALSGA